MIFVYTRRNVNATCCDMSIDLKGQKNQTHTPNRCYLLLPDFFWICFISVLLLGSQNQESRDVQLNDVM